MCVCVCVTGTPTNQSTSLPQSFRAKFRNQVWNMMSFLKGYSAWQFEMFCNKEKGHSDTSTHIIGSAYGSENTI